MGDKVEANKKQKKEALLNTAFELFTSKGIQKTSISDIVEKAGVAKGTFYLYFTDKYDIRNKLISHKASQLFLGALDALHHRSEPIDDFEDQVIFMADHMIDRLATDRSLLMFISKQLSWAIFKDAVISTGNEADKNIYHLYEDILENSGHIFKDPEIMIFTILELVSGTSYNPILYEQPVSIGDMKPYIYKSIRQIIQNHYDD